MNRFTECFKGAEFDAPGSAKRQPSEDPQVKQPSEGQSSEVQLSDQQSCGEVSDV